MALAPGQGTPTEMKLDQAQKINVRLVCSKCEGHQPGYTRLMIEEHGLKADLGETIRVTPCLWCKEVGGLQIAPVDA